MAGNPMEIDATMAMTKMIMLKVTNAFDDINLLGSANM
jgi:hypothetical protein